LALSRVAEIGEQAVAAVAASLVDGGAVLKAQLIASRFYEAVRHELDESSLDDAKRAALIAVSSRCERIAAASTNPTTLLDELRMAIAVLRAHTDASAPPTRARPVLRLIEGGLSKN
jgi:thioesterase domain-containing protein